MVNLNWERKFMTNLYFIAHVDTGQIAICNEALLDLLKIEPGCIARYTVDAFLDQNSLKWYHDLNLNDEIGHKELIGMELMLSENIKLKGDFRVAPLLNFRNQRLALCDFTPHS